MSFSPLYFPSYDYILHYFNAILKIILFVGGGGGSGSNYAGGVPNAAIDALKVKIANNAGLLQELTSLIAQGGAASSAGAAALASSAAGNQGEFSTFIMYGTFIT